MGKGVKILIGLIIALIILWGIVFIGRDIDKTQNSQIQFVLEVKENSEKNIEKITVGELKSKYNYNIYYYGLESVTIKINNEEFDLKKALAKEKITMEEIIEQAKCDEKNGAIKSEMYKDGGSMEYYYDNYTLIKCNSLDGNRDVYIGIPEMNLNSVK